MRQFINIVEENDDPPMTLQSVADYLAEVNDDILPEKFLDTDWTTQDDAACLTLIRRVYLHGSCGELAYALHVKHGWPIYRFAAGFDKVHYACLRPDGMFFDFDGPVTKETILKRYRMPKNTAIQEASPDEATISDVFDSPWTDQGIARFVLAHLGY